MNLTCAFEFLEKFLINLVVDFVPAREIVIITV